MSSFFKKYKFEINIAWVGLGILVSVLYWYDVFENDQKWRWVGGVVFAIWAIIKLVEVLEVYRGRKATKPGKME